MGIIPAYAGNTEVANQETGEIKDHPRVCGEHLARITANRGRAGSSPRMRGTPGCIPCPTSGSGIIPAYAGNTGNTHTSTQQDRDHPRVCGEHKRPHPTRWSSSGSSPRMRGTPWDVAGADLTVGIIPAYAGNTRHDHGRPLRHRDHPRVCGEHPVVLSSGSAVRGSSPRMRGTLGRQVPPVGRPGIIPAYAGNTCELWRDGASPWGSSPRMRGTH